MVRFHVVNSVKGGCGKSTFSLYLANYLIEKNHKVVIIDLDIGGSTWYREFESYLVNTSVESNANNNMVDTRKVNIKFLNELLYEDEFNRASEHVFKLRIQEKYYAANHADMNQKKIVNIVMTNPEKATCIRDEELDLLEGTICNLVDEIAEKSYVDDFNNTIDVIFDMPPGYEEHSERILMHALMDLGSNLHKYYTSLKKDNLYQNPVYLYMISGVKQASLKANIQYVERFYNTPSYSMDIGVLNTDNVFFILNDVDASFDQYIKAHGGHISLQNAGKELIENIMLSERINNTAIQAFFVKHINIQMSHQAYINILTNAEERESSTYVLIDEIDGFKDRFRTMKHLNEEQDEERGKE